MDILSTIRGVIALGREQNLTVLAAGIAYYAFVSIIPLVLLAVVVTSFVGGGAVITDMTSALDRYLSLAGQRSITQMLSDTTGRGPASVVGLLALGWSALKLFRGLDLAFDELYPVGEDSTPLERILDAIIVFLSIVTGVIVVVGGAFALLRLRLEIPYVNLLGAVVLIVVLVLAFLPIYYVLPPVDVSLREVLPGATIAAVGWVLLQFGFRFYAAHAGEYAAYGIIGSALLFVTWLYFASIIVLLGVALNVVLRVPHGKLS